jgi:hypothetical protein
MPPTRAALKTGFRHCPPRTVQLRGAVNLASSFEAWGDLDVFVGAKPILPGSTPRLLELTPLISAKKETQNLSRPKKMGRDTL